MRMIGAVFQGFYLCGGLASLAAITAIFRQLNFPTVVVLAPCLSTIALVLGFQVWAFATLGAPIFAFGVYAAVIPALSLVTPVCIVLIALSNRLRALGATGLKAD